MLATGDMDLLVRYIKVINISQHVTMRTQIAGCIVCVKPQHASVGTHTQAG